MKYSNNQTLIDLNIEGKKVYDTFMNILKEFKEKLINNLKRILSTENDKNEQIIIETKESFKFFEDILKDLEEYEDEFYDYLTIGDMLFYILDDKKLLNNISSIELLINSFFDTLQLKDKLIYEDYSAKVDEFEIELMNYEQFFYTEIYTSSENYDETVLSEITASLVKFD